MAQFYDEDSNDLNSLVKKEKLEDSYYPIDAEEVLSLSIQLIERIQENVDIRTMSIQDISEYAKGNFVISSEMDWDEFDRCLKKRKLIMKKNHAKSRNSNNKKP